VNITHFFLGIANTLAPPASLALASTPPFLSAPGGGRAAQAATSAVHGLTAKREGRLTTEAVHALMVKTLKISKREAQSANPCFKRAVLVVSALYVYL